MSGMDDHLTQAEAELGVPDALFQVSPGWYRTKLAVGLGLVVTGLATNVGWWILGQGNVNHLFIHMLIWPPAVGIALLVHMYRQRGLYVLVYPTGLLRLRRGEVDSFPWPHVSQIRLKTQRAEQAEVERDLDGNPVACWIPVEAPSIQVWTAWLTIARSDGIEAHFGPALANFDSLVETIQRKTFPALWAEAWGRFRSGRMVAFGDLEVHLLGMHHGGKILRWADMKELTIAQGRLTVKQTGRWLPWAVLKDISEVPNPHILFALVSQARALAAHLAAGFLHGEEDSRRKNHEEE